jgi:hypothetical protein
VLLLLGGEFAMRGVVAQTAGVVNRVTGTMLFVFLADSDGMGLVRVSRDLVNIDMGLGCLD